MTETAVPETPAPKPPKRPYVKSGKFSKPTKTRTVKIGNGNGDIKAKIEARIQALLAEVETLRAADATISKLK